MDAIFRSDLKIWVTAAVMLIIFSGIAFSLFQMDKRIQKLEKEEGKKN